MKQSYCYHCVQYFATTTAAAKKDDNMEKTLVLFCAKVKMDFFGAKMINLELD